MENPIPVPTDGDFNYLHPSPLNLLCPDALPADKIYHIILKEKIWDSFSEASKKFEMTYIDDKRPFELGVNNKMLSLRDKMMLRNQEGEVVAVMLRMLMKWENTYKIYGLKPYFRGQFPSQKQKHDDKPLYEWAKCKENKMTTQITMTTVDGVKYATDYVGPISIYRRIRITRDKKPAVLCKELNLGVIEGTQWEIRIGPGNDPALMIAFVAIFYEMDEDKKIMS